MTRAEASEVLVYDLTVRRDYQRRRVGRQLLTTLREAAADGGKHPTTRRAKMAGTFAISALSIP
jgi:GNAT superfamily N-acetyltransferase